MPTLFDSTDRKALEARLDSLNPSCKAAWGNFRLEQMLEHCSRAIEAGLGERKVAPKATPFRYWPLRPLIIYTIPWPKGAPTAPELIPEHTMDWQKGRGRLRGLIVKMAGTPESFVFAEHAAFGKLSRKDWGALTWRHLDHHLTQFGV